MRRTIRFVLALLFASALHAEDLVLLNGTIIDGTLKARYAGSVRIREGRITDAGAFKPMPGETVLDIKGLIVAPGFIDFHNQSIAGIRNDPGASAQIGQGITTVIVGADGTGPYSVEESLSPFDEKPAAVNIAAFVGHSTVRRQIMAADYKRAATADETERMSELVKGGMLEGAFGFASDLAKEPASFSTAEETMALGKAANRYGGTYVIYPRGDSITEIVAIGRAAKAPVHAALAAPNTAALADIGRARAQMVDIAADVYSHMQAGPALRAFLQHAWVLTLPAQYLLDPNAITIERAIRKMTGLPASRIGLRERGVIKKGAPADLVVFSPAQFGVMKYVFVNGVLVLKDGQLTGARPGHALR